MRRTVLGCLAAVLMLMMLPQSKAYQSAEKPVIAQSEMRGMIERYNADIGSVTRKYPTSLSPARAERLRQFYADQMKDLGGMNFEAMGQDGRIDYILFRNYLEHEQRQLELTAKSQNEIAPLLPFAKSLVELDDARRRMETVDPEKAANILNDVRKQIEEARKNIDVLAKPDPKKAAVKKTVANRAVNAVGQVKSALKNWYGFYNGYDPTFSWWVSDPYKKVDDALQSYATALKEKLVGVKEGDDGAIIGDPIGREGLMSELAYEMIPYTPEELIAIANKEFAWCDAEMKKASRDLGYGDDWKKALEHVKTLHVEPGKQPEMVRELALEAIKFVEEKDLVTVPPLAAESWRMEMLTPEQQKQSPFFLGGEMIQVAFPTNTMEHEQKQMSLRGNNVHFSRATVYHELIPGHHLQGFMMDRYKTHRNMFYTPFWVEGNALYWEMTFWDQGFPKTPENRIGMLFWRMHRCARIIFSLSFHLEKMTPQECIDFLVDRVGHERDNATAEVRRSVSGNYGPLYQCAYMLGALQLRALERELVPTGKMTRRAFNDAVLQQNAIPIEMVRAALEGQELSRTFTTKWKFYGDRPADK